MTKKQRREIIKSELRASTLPLNMLFVLNCTHIVCAENPCSVPNSTLWFHFIVEAPGHIVKGTSLVVMDSTVYLIILMVSLRRTITQ